MKPTKQLLFERMHTIGGMPLKEDGNIKLINNDLELLTQEFLLLKENNNEESVIKKIKNAFSRGIKISIIVSALLAAGYSQGQAQDKIEKAKIELSTPKFKKTELEKTIKNLKKEGFSEDVFQNKMSSENLEGKEVKQQKFIGNTLSAVNLQKNQFINTNKINQRDTLVFNKTSDGNVVMIILYAKQ